jgi:hypothetical protein
MIVNQVNVKSPTVFESKNDPPIRADCDCPRALEVPAQRMEPERRHIHNLDRFRRLQRRQNLPDLAHMLGIDAPGVVVVE